MRNIQYRYGYTYQCSIQQNGRFIGLQPYCCIAVTTARQQWQKLIKQTQTYKYTQSIYFAHPR